MRSKAAQLLLSAVFLLLAFTASASLTQPPLPEFQDTALAESEAAVQPVDWAALEADPDAVLVVLLVPFDELENAYIALIPCDPQNRVYRLFRDLQPPLGLSDVLASDSGGNLAYVDSYDLFYLGADAAVSGMQVDRYSSALPFAHRPIFLGDTSIYMGAYQSGEAISSGISAGVQWMGEHPRVMAGAQLVGAGVEIAGGIALAPKTLGGSLLLCLHGADEAGNALYTLTSGETQPTLFESAAFSASEKATGSQMAGVAFVLLLDVALPGPGGSADDVVEVTLRHVDGMPRQQFLRKAGALEELGDQGLLFRAANPVPRDRAITRAYRQDMIRRIYAQYGQQNPEFAKRLIQRVTDPRRMQVDHIWELQLGGPDTAANLRFLDKFTNWHIGMQQIRPQILNLPVGTRIRIRVIGPQ